MPEMKFTMEAGLLLRGPIRRELKRYAFDNDLELDLQEDKGLLSTTFYCTVSGPLGHLLAIKTYLKKMAENSGAITD